MAYEDILYSAENGVAWVTLNRPDKLNAWRGEMERDVRAAMREATNDDNVRVIVLTGAGKGFCAGADMNMLQGIQSSGRNTSAAEPWDASANPNFQKQYSWFPAVPKPIIGSINGSAAGLGRIYGCGTAEAHEKEAHSVEKVGFELQIAREAACVQRSGVDHQHIVARALHCFAVTAAASEGARRLCLLHPALGVLPAAFS
jgi:hypothetical protein